MTTPPRNYQPPRQTYIPTELSYRGQTPRPVVTLTTPPLDRRQIKREIEQRKNAGTLLCEPNDDRFTLSAGGAK